MAYSIVGRFFTNSGVPVAAPAAGYRLPDVMIDITTHKVYEWKNSVWTEKPDFFGVGNKGVTSCLINANGDLVINFTDNTSQNVGKVVGSNGKDGITPQFVTGNTTTLNPGQPATLTLRETSPDVYAVDAAIPKGDKGEPGSGGGTKFNYYSPEQFGTGASAMQACLTAACNDGLPIYSSGTYNCGNTILTLPKQFNSLTWYGGRCKVICGGITRPRPANLTESQQQQNTKYNIYDITISGGGSGTGFEPAANSNSIFQNLSIENFTTSAIFRTTQHAMVNVITMNNCVNGLSFECETFNPTQSQSNDNKVWQPRFHSNLACGYTIKLQGSFGFDCYGLETEGTGTILNVIDFDDLGNNTVKSCRFYEPHRCIFILLIL